METIRDYVQRKTTTRNVDLVEQAQIRELKRVQTLVTKLGGAEVIKSQSQMSAMPAASSTSGGGSQPSGQAAPQDATGTAAPATAPKGDKGKGKGKAKDAGSGKRGRSTGAQPNTGTNPGTQTESRRKFDEIRKRVGPKGEKDYICLWHFGDRGCRMGENCGYSHDASLGLTAEDERIVAKACPAFLRERSNSGKRSTKVADEVCRYYQQGKCVRTNCRFLHVDPVGGKTGNAP